MVNVNVHVGDTSEPVEIKLRKRKFTSASLLKDVSDKLGFSIQWAPGNSLPLQKLNSSNPGVTSLYVTRQNDDMEVDAFDSVTAAPTDVDVAMESSEEPTYAYSEPDAVHLDTRVASAPPPCKLKQMFGTRSTPWL